MKVSCDLDNGQQSTASTGAEDTASSVKRKLDLLPKLNTIDNTTTTISDIKKISDENSSEKRCEVTNGNTGRSDNGEALSNDTKACHQQDDDEESIPKKRQRRRVDRQYYIQPEEQVKPRKEKKKEKKEVDTEAEFETTWICVECKEAECMMEPEATDLLVCDGPCRRLFHYPCAGLTALPAQDDDFICDDCKSQRHKCSICSNYGKDNEDVFKCKKKTCGLFFHESCLAMQNVEVEIIGNSGGGDSAMKQDGNSNDNAETPNTTTTTTTATAQRIFICPAHACWTCVQNDLKEQEQEEANKKELEQQQQELITPNKKQRKIKAKKKMKKNSVFEKKKDKTMTRCLECPIAYHITCIPPNARFHELATLCHEHSATCKLPDLDPEMSYQKKIENKVDEKFEILDSSNKVRKRRRKGNNPFFPGVTGVKLTPRESQLLLNIQNDANDTSSPYSEKLWFCLPCDLKEEVHSKPPAYKHVHTLQYSPSNKPPKVPISSEVCHCIDRCGDDCMNRMLYTECIGDPNAGKNKGGNCRVGPDCGNRQLGQRKAAKCVPKREKGRGWGLITLHKIKKGDLVQEYIGEVIDAKTKEQRLTEWTKEHPNDPNFYVMALQSGWFIDARDIANLARFINHSCEPNGSLVQINVNGKMHCGIFARRDIEPGEFLSYDYRFDTKHADQFICCCGSVNCRGTMKFRNNQLNEDSLSKKSKSEKFEEAKASLERDKKFIADFYDERDARRNQVNEFVPGADSNGMEELVSNGVLKKNKPKVQECKIFLWRNAVRGSDFASRIARIESKKDQKKSDNNITHED